MRFEPMVGLRLTRSRRRNFFISIIALISMLGIALGVATLIVVLSVMNGFQEELRTRILAVTAHLEVHSPNDSLSAWQEIENRLATLPDVVGMAPFVNGEGLLSYRGQVQGVRARGVLPTQETQVSDFKQYMLDGDLHQLEPGNFGIILGQDLALRLGIRVGEKLVFIAPSTLVTPAGVLPRLKQFTVVGIFAAGFSEYDAGLALLNIDDARALYRLPGVSGVRLKIRDLLQARLVGMQVEEKLSSPPQLADDLYITDWTRNHSNLFRAIQIEKRMMLIILTLIVAVAAFNVISALVMSVNEKKADIAILRTLGAGTKSIMTIFTISGLTVGLVGLALGVVGGVLLAWNVQEVVNFIERILGIHFLAKDVYYITELPSRIIVSDVVMICVITFILTLAAAILPSWQAARIRPAAALRYE